MQDEGNSYRDMLLIDLCGSEISISVKIDPQCHAISPLRLRQLRDGCVLSDSGGLFLPVR